MEDKLKIGYKVVHKKPESFSPRYCSSVVNYNSAMVNYAIGMKCNPLPGTPIFLFAKLEDAKAFCINRRDSAILRVKYKQYKTKKVLLVLPRSDLKEDLIHKFWEKSNKSPLDIQKTFGYYALVPFGTIYAEYVIPIKEIV